MIKGVVDIYYNVSNMDKSVELYSSLFNMTKLYGDQYWTSLDADGVKIGLHWTEGGEVPSVPKDSHGAHAGATLTLRSTDIAKDKELIQNAGLTILGEADAPWGHMLIFEDYDGNVLKLMNPK